METNPRLERLQSLANFFKSHNFEVENLVNPDIATQRTIDFYFLATFFDKYGSSVDGFETNNLEHFKDEIRNMLASNPRFVSAEIMEAEAIELTRTVATIKLARTVQ